MKRNWGTGGVDGEDLAAFEASLDANLEQLHRELRDWEYVLPLVLRWPETCCRPWVPARSNADSVGIPVKPITGSTLISITDSTASRSSANSPRLSSRGCVPTSS